MITADQVRKLMQPKELSVENQLIRVKTLIEDAALSGKYHINMTSPFWAKKSLEWKSIKCELQAAGFKVEFFTDDAFINGIPIYDNEEAFTRISW